MGFYTCQKNCVITKFFVSHIINGVNHMTENNVTFNVCVRTKIGKFLIETEP